ncbi:MAG: hypothetical protein VYD19_03905, partial [Myxococcota bacterium]|nr:hypothetical protein [Myxococcota bacterium]
ANLPVPPPDFSYQGLTQRFGFDLDGLRSRLSLQLSLLDTLGAFAHWLTSYMLSLHIDEDGTQGEAIERWSIELGYAFHWRWAARFTVDAGLSGALGWRVREQESDLLLGLSPMVGLTLLPEGWLKIPLEVSLAYQLPLTFYDAGRGFPGADLIEGQILSIGLGLAFMR